MSETAGMDGQRELHNAYLQAMGITRWVSRQIAEPPGNESVCEKTASATAGPVHDWVALESEVAGCTRCGLHETRTQTVFGTGNRTADWLIIGEAPGADEDRAGEPFVGRAGLLLNEMLLAAGFQRDEVYIANILKCRPPDNRNPRPDEVRCCQDYLQRQVELLQPRLILAVGKIAAQSLLDSSQPVGRLRGTQHHYGNKKIPLVVTYHPAYLLRSPMEKRKVWTDLQLARRIFLTPG
jgi:DNA polymerase